ncbi:MAG: DNA replication and repair protein RecF [Patescibacteria group bacterium]|nr:DNA replication and repair protein RecF [Patescibacteria group bacterium]
MFLSSISLQNFRSYKKSEFKFGKNCTVIVGPNTSGKTNLLEAIYFISTGSSFRAGKDFEAIIFNDDIARIKGEIISNNEKTGLEIVITNGRLEGNDKPSKKYLVNGVPKRKIDFMGNFQTVMFSPEDLDIIVDSPFLRRNFLNSVLEQVDRDYRIALTSYEKGLRQRNALLEQVKITGRRNEKQFEYWDELLIKNGEAITKKRGEFVEFLNNSDKEIFDFLITYDKSIISKDRLLQYKEAEVGATVTLVGPHRDDFSVFMFNNSRQTTHNVKFFASRGQQRLVILQLKLLQLSFIEKKLNLRPAFLLDDIFSELDEKHIELVLEIVDKQQTVITTTHKEFIPKQLIKKIDIITLGKE